MTRHGRGWAAACLLTLCGPVQAWAQSAEASPAAPATPDVETPAPASEAAPQTRTVPSGALVAVELTEPLSATKAKAGDRFGLRLVEPIAVDGVVVVPAGALGWGQVIDAKAPNIGGRPGRLVLAARYLESGTLRLKLQSFKLGGGGRDNSGLAVGAVIAVGPVGALIPGGGVEYPAGTRATAKVAADPAPTSSQP